MSFKQEVADKIMGLTSKYMKAHLIAISHGPTISNLVTLKTSNYTIKNKVQLMSIDVHSHVYSTINFLM